MTWMLAIAHSGLKIAKRVDNKSPDISLNVLKYADGFIRGQLVHSNGKLIADVVISDVEANEHDRREDWQPL